jgi:hypothetical protein
MVIAKVGFVYSFGCSNIILTIVSNDLPLFFRNRLVPVELNFFMLDSFVFELVLPPFEALLLSDYVENIRI